MRFIALAAFLISMIGCGGKLDLSSIPGRYEADHGKGGDSIKVMPDGTYAYTFLGKDGRKLENNGKWSAAREGTRIVVTFEDFVFGLPGAAGAKPAYWVVTAERCQGGKTCLNLDPDLNYYYRRVEAY